MRLDYQILLKSSPNLTVGSAPGRDALTRSKTFLVLVISISWRTKTFSNIAFCLTNLSSATNRLKDLISVVSPNRRLILHGPSWIWAISWFKRSFAMSAILLFAMPPYNETASILFASFRPSNIRVIFTAGLYEFLTSYVMCFCFYQRNFIENRRSGGKLGRSLTQGGLLLCRPITNFLLWTFELRLEDSRVVSRGGGETPLEIFSSPLEKRVGHSLQLLDIG